MKILLRCFLILIVFVFATDGFSATYYVDSIGGNDTNSGTSSASAWQSIDKVSATTFSPGDSILFKYGSSWTGQLYPKGSGVDGSPIMIAGYGDPNAGRPHINANGLGGGNWGAFNLYNQEYWEINDLSLSNYNPTNYDAKTAVAIYIVNDGTLPPDVNQMNHIYLNNLEVHNVNGQLSNYNNGGIRMFAQSTIGVNSATRVSFNDVNISNCYIHDINTAGFINYSSWAVREPEGDPMFAPWTNFVMRNNVWYRCSGRAFHLRSMDGALVEYNVAYENNYVDGEDPPEEANCFIMFNCNNSIWQFNEVYDHAKFPPEPDGGAFDVDFRTFNNIVQYNYDHDNGMSWVAPCMGRTATRFNKNTIFRYNISQNAKYEVIHMSGGVDNAKFYNNVIYLGPSTSNVMIVSQKNWDGAYPDNTGFFNNIIYNLGTNNYYDFTNSTNNVFDNNVFYGIHPASEPADANKITSDPQFIFAGSGGKGLDSVGGYMLLPTSPCIDAGIFVDGNNGGFDYWGNIVPANGTPDIGAYEYPRDNNDFTPPVPNPIGFAEEPNTLSGSVIRMTAQKAVDPNGFGVQYYFANVNDANHDSGWQGNPSYVDAGLNPNTSYTYKVKARDVSPNYNETSYSAEKSATTLEQAVIYPEADTFVRAGTYAGDNYGNDATLCVKTATESYIRRSFIRFDLSGVSEPIISASLRLYVNRKDADTVHDVNFVSSDSWSETTMTWNTQPASGATLDSQSIPDEGSWVEFDVTAQVLTELSGDGKISLMIHEPTAVTYTLYDSKETAVFENTPQLVIVFPLAGDFEPDGDVDWDDLQTFVNNWLYSCTSPDWCGGTDINNSGRVDFVDYSKLAENWMRIR